MKQTSRVAKENESKSLPVWLVGALGVFLGACTVPALGLEGLACDTAHVCVAGYTCVNSQCVAVGDSTDGGTGSDRVYFLEDFESFNIGETWEEGSAHGAIGVQAGAQGSAGIESDGSKVLSNTALLSAPGHLFESLQPIGDVDFSVRLKTVQQIRGPPNPWEVGWVCWHWTDSTHYYYVVLGKESFELTKRDPTYPYEVRSLSIDYVKTYPIDTWYTLRVRQVANVITVYVNGVRIVTYTDNETPYLEGKLGLMSVDSKVRWDDLVVSAPTP